MIDCKTCLKNLPTNKFFKSNGKLSNFECKDCHYIRKQEWNRSEAGRHSSRQTKYKKRYGITIDQYEYLETKQDNKCYICKQPETRVDNNTGNISRLSIDHCHITGRIRGLLCNTCNRLEGLFRLQPYKYIEVYKHFTYFSKETKGKK